MKKYVLAVLVSLALMPSYADEPDQRAAQSRQAVKEFAKLLKGHLMAGMQEGGPVAAVHSCNLAAPSIAEQISQKTNWEVGRTALKIRNPNNAPDTWELSVLESFEDQKRRGADPKQLEHYEVVTENGKQYFRYMKAIPTGALCLACHGESIDEGVVQALQPLYPQDEARGFRQGDIRGAFTIRQPMSRS